MIPVRPVWQSFWGQLDTPSSFPNDWYGAATNQATHWAVAMFSTIAFCLVYGLVFSEMPYRWPVFAGASLGYLFYVEVWRQGWQGADSINDWVFWSLGAAVPLVALEEVWFRPNVCLEPRNVEGLALLGATAVIYLAHIIPRYLRQQKEAT